MEDPPKASLFDLDHAELDLLDRLEALFAEPIDDIDPGAVAEGMVDAHLAALGEVQEQLAAKLVGYVKAINAKRASCVMLGAEARLFAIEAERLAARSRSEADTADFLEGRLKEFMERRGLAQLEAGTHRLKIVKVGGKLPLVIAPGVTPADVPAEFVKEIPARRDFNKDAIEQSLKEGAPLMIERAGDEGATAEPMPWAWHGARPTKLKIS